MRRKRNSKQKKRKKGKTFFSFVFFLYGNIAQWGKNDAELLGKKYLQRKELCTQNSFSPCFEMTTVAQTQEIVAKFSHMVDPMKEYTGDEMANMLGKVFRDVTGKEITAHKTDGTDNKCHLEEENKRLRKGNLFLDIISSDAFDIITKNLNTAKHLSFQEIQIGDKVEFVYKGGIWVGHVYKKYRKRIGVKAKLYGSSSKIDTAWKCDVRSLKLTDKN